MSFITKKFMPRRTFLRGVGATMALPLLEAMVPAATPLAKTAANPVRRLGFVFPPGGVHRLWSQPIGMKTNPSRRTGLAAVLASGVAAGTIASSNGNAIVAPTPRRKVRRGMNFLVRIENRPD